jgi:hypothetical protein
MQALTLAPARRLRMDWLSGAASRPIQIPPSASLPPPFNKGGFWGLWLSGITYFRLRCPPCQRGMSSIGDRGICFNARLSSYQYGTAGCQIPPSASLSPLFDKETTKACGGCGRYGIESRRFFGRSSILGRCPPLTREAGKIRKEKRPRRFAWRGRKRSPYL